MSARRVAIGPQQCLPEFIALDREQFPSVDVFTIAFGADAHLLASDWLDIGYRLVIAQLQR